MSTHLVRGEYDAAMAMLIEQAEQGQFPIFYSGLPIYSFALEEHPDYPRFVSMLQAFRQEQRELYDRLSAAN
jgi:hypothetical protein